ncbi:hypothetical protein L5515_003054 [Caenorhabditis briggsae]|uniref:Uncharacterized protein n=1 Tax=Caenorhabditis briggsae TaxID=6238 RepID=A0AAE9EKX1_CAEBR|nr:hypothetical protein L5515_003054 [Caenorhabditis briggsae]
MNKLCLISSILVASIVLAFPGGHEKEPMEGGPMNMTDDDLPMNMTHKGPWKHHGQGSADDKNLKEKPEKPEKPENPTHVPADRKRRGIYDDAKQAGQSAVRSVESVGGKVMDTVEGAANTVWSTGENAMDHVKTGASDVVDKVKEIAFLGNEIIGSQWIEHRKQN